MLDPDGDVVRYLKRRRLANAAVNWACYHTEMWRFAWDGTEFGIVGCAVGAPFAGSWPSRCSPPAAGSW